MRRVLAIIPDYIPSAVLNVVVPLEYLQASGSIAFEVVLESQVTPPRLASADVIVACRNVEPTYRPVFELAQRLGIPIIYDIDDNLFDIPESDEYSAYYRHPGRLSHLEWMLRNAYLVRTHSAPLSERLAVYNASIRQVWSAVDWSLVPNELPTLSFDPVSIVYATSRTTGDILFQHIKQDLITALTRYGKRIRVVILGSNPQELQRFPNVVHQPFMTDTKSFYHAFYRAGYAIGLAPMLTDSFHQCKTDLKFRDYASAGIVGIYQDCPLYRASIEDGHTGFFVSGEQGSWVAMLEQLINDPGLVTTIRRNARRVAQERYSLDAASELWWEDIQSAPERLPQSTEVLPRRWAFTRPNTTLYRAAQQLYRLLVPSSWRIRLRNLCTGRIRNS